MSRPSLVQFGRVVRSVFGTVFSVTVRKLERELGLSADVYGSVCGHNLLNAYQALTESNNEVRLELRVLPWEKSRAKQLRASWNR